MRAHQITGKLRLARATPLIQQQWEAGAWKYTLMGGPAANSWIRRDWPRGSAGADSGACDPDR